MAGPQEGRCEVRVVPCQADVNTQLYGLFCAGTERQTFQKLQDEFIEDEAASSQEEFSAYEILFEQGLIRELELKLQNSGIVDILGYRFGLDEVDLIQVDQYTTDFNALLDETNPATRAPDFLLDTAVHAALVSLQFHALLASNGKTLFLPSALDQLKEMDTQGHVKAWDTIAVLEIYRCCILLAFGTNQQKVAFMNRFYFLRRLIGCRKDMPFYQLPDTPALPPLNKLFTINCLKVGATVHATLPRATLPVYRCYELRRRGQTFLVEPDAVDPVDFTVRPGLERAGCKIHVINGSFSCLMAGEDNEEVVQASSDDVPQTLRQMKFKVFYNWEWIDGAQFVSYASGFDLKFRRTKIPFRSPVCFLRDHSPYLSVSNGFQPLLLQAKSPAEAAQTAYLINKQAGLLFE